MIIHITNTDVMLIKRVKHQLSEISNGTSFAMHTGSLLPTFS